MATRGKEIPTIDVELVTVQAGEDGEELGLYTANQISVAVQTETIDAVKLVVKDRLIAQKRKKEIVTGNEITLTDNVFNVQLVKILQGGTIVTDTSGKITGYKPPKTGSGESGKIFKLIVYSTIYDESGVIKGYEKVTYPNCTGNPIALSAQDGTFRASEYVITSAPSKDEEPYTIDYVDTLPVLTDYVEAPEVSS